VYTNFTYLLHLLEDIVPRPHTGALLLEPTEGLQSPTPWIGPFWKFLNSPPVNSLHCKILRTPMSSIVTVSSSILGHLATNPNMCFGLYRVKLHRIAVQKFLLLDKLTFSCDLFHDFLSNACGNSTIYCGPNETNYAQVLPISCSYYGRIFFEGSATEPETDAVLSDWPDRRLPSIRV